MATPSRTCTLRGGFLIRIGRDLSQLGSVWLPLPHLLLIPFVAVYAWWANGIAGMIPSALAYIAACAGIYRLARHWLAPSAAVVALAFFALNPNLLYLQTTAMTEPLFLCEMVWLAVWLVEWRGALNNDPPRAARLLRCIALVLIAAVFTRYDGWILAASRLDLRRHRAASHEHTSLAHLLDRKCSRGCRTACFGLHTTLSSSETGSTSRAVLTLRLRSSYVPRRPAQVRRIRAGTIHGFRFCFL